MVVAVTSPYCIKENYVERPHPTYFVDDGAAGITFQPEVYTYAETLTNHGIFDVGCGRAGKLAELYERHPDWVFLGVDYGVNIDYCRETYDWGSWYVADLEEGLPPINPDDLTIVCADVIEHLMDPRPLLQSIRNTECLTVFSTPERDLWYGEDHNGPPPNPCHVREWNLVEFAAFLAQEGFALANLGLTASDDAGAGSNTILATAVPA